MDNITTGSFIKQLRKEKDMTQKQLADLLHITDRAVSKWERGVCAPDISLLEPLAEILEVSIVELIRGERAERPEELEPTLEDGLVLVERLREEGLSLRDAVKRAAKELGLSRNQLYDASLSGGGDAAKP